MKRGKKGLSTIVATLIVVLLVFVAVGILWVVLRNFISGGAEQISLGKLTLNMQIENVQYINDANISVKVKRNTGAGNFTGINFVIYDSSGDNNEVVRVDNVMMNELDEQTFSLTLGVVNASEISKVEIVPVFTLESGKESLGDVKDTLVLQEATPGQGSQGGSQCTNECSSLGSSQCLTSTSYQTCGNYDSDSCLEWDSAVSCGNGEACSLGLCVSSGNNPPGFTNLITWLRFEGNLLDEQENNDANLNGAIPYSQGYGEGQSLDFPGLGNPTPYVNLPISISGNELTIAFWANADDTSELRGFFNYNYNSGYRSRISGSHVQLLILGSSCSYSGSTILPQGSWVHYAYTFNSVTNEVRVYVNGVEEISQTCSQLNIATSYLQIGKSWTDSELFKGRFDEFMVYNRVLTPTEISDLASYSA